MSTKKIIFSVIVVVLLAGLIYLIVRFHPSDKEVADYVMPQIQLVQMQITSLTADRADMQMNVVIDNPAPIGLHIDSLYYIVSIEDNEVVESTYPDAVQIEANDTTSISLPLTIYYDTLQSVLDALEQQGKDSVVYKISATIFSDMDIIPEDKIEVEVEKLLPLIKPPEIDVTDLSVEDVGFSGATIVVEALVDNKNVYSLSFEDMDYSLQIEDNEAIEGHKSEVINIPAKDSAQVTIPVEIDFKEMGKGLIDLIRKGDDLTYNFILKTALVSDEHILQESEITLNATGSLKELKEVVKEQKEEN